MTYARVVDFLIDLAPFILYLAMLVKLHFSWKVIKANADEVRRERLAAAFLILAIVIALFLASNLYALAVYGKTYLSLRFFQMFIVSNCIAYWLLLDILTKDSVPAEGRLRESAD